MRWLRRSFEEERRWLFLLLLLLAAVVTLVFAQLTAAAAPVEPSARLGFPTGRRGKRPAAAPRLRPVPVPRVFCERPRALRLRRFEDGSARLECAGRVIARVSVSG